MKLDDEPLQAADVEVGNEALIVKLKGGRTVTTPLWRYPRLSSATLAIREKWKIMPFGDAAEWDELDEHISVKGMLRGHPAPSAKPPLGKADIRQ